MHFPIWNIAHGSVAGGAGPRPLEEELRDVELEEPDDDREVRDAEDDLDVLDDFDVFEDDAGPPRRF